MATVSQQIQQIYIGLLGRAADQAGLDYWTAEIEGGVLTLEQLRANIVNEQPEYAAGQGSMTRPQAVADLYENLFNRAPEAAGLEYWVSGGGASVNIDQLVLALINGASASDQLVLDNKTEVAEYYTAAAGADYSADAAAGAVANVDGTRDSVDAAKTAIDSGAVATGQTYTLTANADTPNASAPAVNTQGTSGNDTYKAVIDSVTAANTTLQATDDIDGAGGVDTLAITAIGGATATPLFLKNVEKVSVKDVDAAGTTTVNLVNATGVTEVINDASAGAVVFQNIGNAAVTVQNVKTDLAGTTVGTTFTRGSSPVTSDLTLNLNSLGSAAAPGAAAIQIDAINSEDGNNDAVNVTINATGYVSVLSAGLTGTTDANANGTFNEAADLATHTAETVTINAAGTTIFGAAGGVADLTGFNTAKAGKIVVTGAGAVTLNELAGAVKTVDASANTGGVTLVGTTYTGTEAAAQAAPGLSVTGGTGKDSISVDGVASAVVSAGAGDDTVTLTNTHAAGAKIDGGEGTDRIVLTSAMADALDAQTAAGTALRATLTGFEQIGIAAGADATQGLAAGFNLAQAGGYNYLALNGNVNDLSFVDAGGLDGLRAADGSEDSLTAITVNGFTTGATVEFRLAGNQTDTLEIGMTGAAESSTDVVNLKLNANLANGSNFTVRAGVQGINNVNIDANDRTNDVTDDNQALAANKDNSADDGYTVVLSNAANVNNIAITGTSAVSYTLQAGTDAVKLIDASASTGNMTINVANFAGTERLEIKGSKGTNNITGDDAAFGEKITGGAANDIITAGAGADDVTGNGGRDAFVVNAGDARGVTAATVDQISDFAKVSVATTAAEANAMTNVADFQAAATAKGGADADLLDFVGAVQTAVATAQTAADGAAILVALEALDPAPDQYTGKDISATISSKGILTIAGANAADIDTLAEWVAVANIAAGANGETTAFQFNGNTYVFQQQVAGDELVELTGLTGVTGLVEIGVVGGTVAAAVGDIFVL